MTVNGSTDSRKRQAEPVERRDARHGGQMEQRESAATTQPGNVNIIMILVCVERRKTSKFNP